MFRGPVSRCCSTYLGPGDVPRGGQRGGALLHQIWEIGVAQEQISVARETVAGGRAPPRSPRSLEKEKKRGGTGYCAAKL